MAIGSKTGGRDFKAGEGGRPKGSRSPALVALDAIGNENAEELIRSVTAAALAGDMRAADILLRRVWPERKGRPITFTLPEMRTAEDLAAAMWAVTSAVADGRLTPDEGQSVASIIEVQRRSIETAELERRIVALEGKGVGA